MRHHLFTLSAKKCQQHSASTDKLFETQCKEQLKVPFELFLEQLNHSTWSIFSNVDVAFVQVSATWELLGDLGNYVV